MDMPCGVGAEYYMLRPGQSLEFTVSVLAEQAGQQLRVAVRCYASPDGRNAFVVKSDVATVPRPAGKPVVERVSLAG